MKFLTLKAYAKINLFLKVLGKRLDGYHQIETLFERVSLCDEITLSPLQEGIQLETKGENLPSGPENLAYRAAEIFLDRFGIKKGVRIHLEKRIPVAAGLGGGSSDAAAVLLGLDRLFGIGAKKEGLMKLGGELGADVPFFLLETRRALGKGRGDELEVEPDGPRCFYLLVTPPVTVLTRDSYEAWDRLNALTVAPSGAKINRRTETVWANDLEPVVLQQYPVVAEVYSFLRQLGPKPPQLSGSGPTVFMEVSGAKEAMRWASEVRGLKRGWRVEWVRAC